MAIPSYAAGLKAGTSTLSVTARSESRLRFLSQQHSTHGAPSPSGKAEVCKTSTPGSNPGGASNSKPHIDEDLPERRAWPRLSTRRTSGSHRVMRLLERTDAIETHSCDDSFEMASWSHWAHLTGTGCFSSSNQFVTTSNSRSLQSPFSPYSTRNRAPSGDIAQ